MSDRPLFSQVGRPDRGPAPASSRAFNLVIVLGLLAAVFGFLYELGARPPAMRFVEVDMTARPEP